MRFVIAMASMVAVASTSCMTVSEFYESRTPEWVAEHTKAEYDGFKRTTDVVSPTVVSYPGHNGERIKVRLRGWDSERVGKNFQVYVHSVHGGRWRFYHSAYDEDGTMLPITKVSSRSDCRGGRSCVLHEVVGVNVTRNYLDGRRGSGLRIKVDGQAGEVVFRVPVGYVEGFLRKFDASGAMRAALPGGTSARR